MIRTFAYNEFEEDGLILNKTKALEDIEEFIKAGGNLNYPVKHRDTFIPASKFFEKNLGEEIVTQLFQNNYLDSPGNWKLNESTKTIIESKHYHSYWYRDNYPKYRKVISEGFRNICQSYVQNPIYNSYEFTDEYRDSAKNNEYIIKLNDCNPLVRIILRMPFKEMINVFLEEVPNAKELLNEQTYGKKSLYNSVVWDSLISNTQDGEDILISLFKHKIIDLDINYLIQNYKFDEVIKKAIYENDFNFINLLKEQSNNPHYIGELDKENSMYESFLRRANTPEMAKILIDSGCPVLREGESYEKFLFSHEYFPIQKLDVIKFIIDYVPMDYMGKSANIFWAYLDKSNTLDDFKKFTEFIVSKGFPLENYDLFNICPGDSWEEKIKTCLELGANVNNTKNLIQRLISKRDISSFKAIQKTKLIDLYSPDSVSHLLSAEDHTKTTLELLDKADLNKLNSLTSLGTPAWFSANSKTKLHKILKKIESFNQVDSLGNNWITNYYSNKVKDKYDIAPLVLEMAAIEHNKKKRLLVLTNVENQSNLLHHGFKFSQYQEKELKEEFVVIIKCFDTTNLNELFSHLDEHGLFPIDYLINSKNDEETWNHSLWDVKLDSLLKLTEYNLDYDKENIHGEKLIDKLKIYYSIDNKSDIFIEPVNKAYSRYCLYNKLEEKLIPENKKSSKHKI